MSVRVCCTNTYYAAKYKIEEIYPSDSNQYDDIYGTL